MRTIAALCVAVLVLGGCGQSEREKVESATRDYLNAISSRDAEAACDLLTREAQVRAFRINRVHAGTDHPRQACASAVRGFHPLYGLKRVRLASITGVEVDGDRAEASVDGVRVKLAKDAGRWKLAVAAVGSRVGDIPPPRRSE